MPAVKFFNSPPIPRGMKGIHRDGAGRTPDQVYFAWSGPRRIKTSHHPRTSASLGAQRETSSAQQQPFFFFCTVAARVAGFFPAEGFLPDEAGFAAGFLPAEAGFAAGFAAGFEAAEAGLAAGFESFVSVVEAGAVP